jgi:hypothetical protein
VGHKSAALASCAVNVCVVQASGFCYINDIVLAILELLKYHRYEAVCCLTQLCAHVVPISHVGLLHGVFMVPA